LDFKLKIKGNRAVLTIKTNGGEFVEDLATESTPEGKWIVNDNVIYNIISVAYELNKFNYLSNFEFLERVFEEFFTHSERIQFLKEKQSELL
jgi:hypothetical protein